MMALAADEPVPEESLLRYHSGDLPRDERAELAAQIDGDPASRATLAEWQRQDAAIAALSAPVAEEALPPPLARLLDEARAAPVRAGIGLPRGWLLVGAVLLLAFGAGLGWGSRALFRPHPPATAAAAALAFRTYAAQVQPVELATADPLTLADWLSPRIGQPVAPPDLARAGLTLLGGRVLPSPAGSAALILYQDAAGRRAGLYLAPGCPPGPAALAAFADPPGYSWQSRGLCAALTGAVPADTLSRAATLAYDGTL